MLLSSRMVQACRQPLGGLKTITQSSRPLTRSFCSIGSLNSVSNSNNFHSTLTNSRSMQARVNHNVAMAATTLLPTTRAFSSNASPDISGLNSSVLAVLGAQWGDEGKGKLVDILAANYDYIARFNGGSNAGHTLVVGGKKFPFHLLPCGMLRPDKINVIGNGVVLHTPTMFRELATLDDNNIDYQGRLKISTRAHLLFDAHQLVDGLQEGAKKEGEKIGTTGRGIGPCYGTKIQRVGVRAGELQDFPEFERKYHKVIDALQHQFGPFEYDRDEELSRYRGYAEKVVPMLIDTVSEMNRIIAEGGSVLAEGANAALLDIDFGTYPFVTSSSTVGGGIATGLGIPGSKLQTTIGIVKAYTTRVGEGPFPTELHDDIGHELMTVGHEYGTTTGRERRCGWLDLPVVQYSHALNNYTSINITKLDVLSGLEKIKLGAYYTLHGKRLPLAYMPSLLSELGEIQVEYETFEGWKEDISKCRKISELPLNARRYLDAIEQHLNVPISWVGVGPGREEMATSF